MIDALESARWRVDRVAPLWPFAMIAAAGGLVFAWMSDAVGDRDGVTAIDGPVASWFAVHRTDAEGQMGMLLAKATSPAVLIAGVLIAAGILLYRRRNLDAAVLVGATVLAYGSGAIAKIAEHRARPSAPINLAPESEPSFPSGHVLVITVIAIIAVMLAWGYLPSLGRLLVLATATTAITVVSIDRLLVGAHWATDVIGSLALAAVIAAAVIAVRSLVAGTVSH